MTTASRIQVWDLPTRVFHWSLALAVGLAILSGEVGGDWIEWHGRLGLLILALIGFRLAWGVIGAPTARFLHFVRGPQSIRDYLRGEWQGIGHNPLGALSVLALLAVITAQAALGLFANDDIAFQGPLAALVSSEASDHARALHGKVVYGLFALIALHVAAIFYYTRVRREILIGPMLRGWRTLQTGAVPDVKIHQPLDPRSPWRKTLALLLALGVSAAVLYAASGRWLPSGSGALAPITFFPTKHRTT